MQAWRIYCGRRRPDGSAVPRADVRAFLTSAVQPRYAAFTVHDASGFWHAAEEPSLVIEILTGDDSASRAVHEIATEYKRRFDQEAVLVVRSTVRSELV